MPITLRPNQVGMCDAAEAAFARGVKRPLNVSAVGSGKSFGIGELARRFYVGRGVRSLILSHVRELVAQNANAARLLMPGVHVGINASALGERIWRAPIISASIQSVYKNARSLGNIGLVLADECHLWPHSDDGMFHALIRQLGNPLVCGFTATPERLQSGSLVAGEKAPFDEIVFRYSILDGLRDGYLCPAFSVRGDDAVDTSKLRKSHGDFTEASATDALAPMADNHVLQMLHFGEDRRKWLIFCVGQRHARVVLERLAARGVTAGLVLADTPAGERARLIDDYRAGRIRALVNVAALTTGFDVPDVDMLVLLRPTMSRVLYEQMIGRGLRVAPGKLDCMVLDFAGNIERHGPLDFIKPITEKRARLVHCDHCGALNSQAARRCWQCDAEMVKLCPGCLTAVPKYVMTCPVCAHDMHSGPRDTKLNLSEVPSGAALLSSYRQNKPRSGGWVAVHKVYSDADAQQCILHCDGDVTVTLNDVEFGGFGKSAKWCKFTPDGALAALLCPNGASRTSAFQVDAMGRVLAVPLPTPVAA